LRKHFWDGDFFSLNPQTHPEYIIERILEFGDVRDLKWMMKSYSIDAVRDVICKTRGLSLKTRYIRGEPLKPP